MWILRQIVLCFGIAVMLAACGEAGGYIAGTVIGCELTDCLEKDDGQRDR